MDLEYKLRLHIFFFQPAVHIYHRDLDYISRRTLDGRIHSHPLTEIPLGEVLRAQLRYRPSAPEHDTDSSYITIEDLAELQDGYSSLPVKMFGSSSDFDPKRISRVLYESDEIHSKSCYSLCSVSAKEDGKSYLDYFVTSFEEVLYFELIEMIRRKISVATWHLLFSN